jgi:hypothetical protein
MSKKTAKKPAYKTSEKWALSAERDQTLKTFVSAADRWSSANNSSRTSATSALVKEGIINASGKLTKNYR